MATTEIYRKQVEKYFEQLEAIERRISRVYNRMRSAEKPTKQLDNLNLRWQRICLQLEMYRAGEVQMRKSGFSFKRKGTDCYYNFGDVCAS